MTTPAISADSHMDLTYMPHDAFTSRVAQKWKDRVPHIVETSAGKFWYGDGKRLSRFGYYGPGLNAGKRGALLVAEGFASGEKPVRPTRSCAFRIKTAMAWPARLSTGFSAYRKA